MPATFDQAALLDRVDNDVEFLAETIEMLASDGRALLADVRQSVASGDAAGIGRAAHALKGMISNFCAPAAHASAMAVEKIGKGGDLAAAGAAVDALDEQLAGLIAALTEFLKTRA